MVIDQRNAGASVTPASGTYTLDRWVAYLSQASKYTIQQNAGSVTPPVGFINYLGLTVAASANVTVGATDFFSVSQWIEGFNVADLDFGTANAKTVTLSFWVRSSLTGTFGGALRNSAGNRTYPFTYIISSANTWEQKSVTIPGDTTGTWLKNNETGLQIWLSIGTGSTYSDTAGAWTAKQFVTTANGATNLISTNSATFYITGVQLEVGSTATSFDYRPYGTELALCQRYYYRIKQDGVANTRMSNSGQCYATNGAIVQTSFLVEMRTPPTALEQSGTAGDYRVFNSGGSGATCTSVPTFNVAGKWYAETVMNVASGLVAGNATYASAVTANAYLGWSAEL